MKGAPGSFLGGSPRRCGSASVVQRPRGTGERFDVRNPASARVIGGGGGGEWMVLGKVGGMVLGEGGGGRMVFAGDGFAVFGFFFSFGFLAFTSKNKTNFLFLHCLKSKLE